MGHSIFLNAMGITSCLGVGQSKTLEALMSGDQSKMLRTDAWTPGTEEVIGQVGDSLPALPLSELAFQSRNNQILLSALEQIRPEIEKTISKVGASRVGVILGSSTSGIEQSEIAMRYRQTHGEFPSHYHFGQQEIGSPSLFTATMFGTLGPAYSVSSACASGGKAFSAGARLINAGLCDAVIVGGADSLCTMTVGGFRSLQAISDEICNPMSRNRSGTNIGEGAAVFLMTREPSKVRYLGAGESSDAHHISAPAPDGSGAAIAMQKALEAAGISADDVSYINLHGTATELNDQMESLAISHIFGTDIQVSSTKPMTGHALGAAGALEAAFLWLALSQDHSDRQLPPHLWDGEVDKSLPRLRLVAGAEKMDIEKKPIMMSNSFAFGGSNVSLILGAET